MKFIRHPTKGAGIASEDTAGVDTAGVDTAGEDTAGVHTASTATATAQYGPRMKGGANESAFDVRMCVMG